MRKTKIVCTLGPATDRKDILESLIKKGMNVARFNFSHGNQEEHKKRLTLLNDLRKGPYQYTATLLDTKGPEIRIGVFENNKVKLEQGQAFTLTVRDVIGTKNIVSVSYKHIVHDVKAGNHIFLDDGLIDLKIDSITDTDILCTVLNGGYVSNNKGVNIPDTHLSMEYLSKRDKSDLIFGIQHGFDFVSASFVRSARDIKQIRDFLVQNGGEEIKLISKIENREGVDNLEEIIKESDGIMIARGDLGVELPIEEIPIVQKRIIKMTRSVGKQVITATQMLDSMMYKPRPTRAEAADVANAIYDGTSAIMLSGETAAGDYPVEALTTMIKIAKKAEEAIDYKTRFFSRKINKNSDITETISHATVTTALNLNAKAILTLTESGNTARMVSRYCPACIIAGCSTHLKVCRQLSLSFGVMPIMFLEKQNILDLFEYAINETKEQGYIEKDDIVVITAGIPLGYSGGTNMIKVQTIT
ncbi:MAG TPA: pyruvate kinase [Treponemataceae bacterium]|nr:pyruvate kinase [Treponemataceae bacterium]